MIPASSDGDCAIVADRRLFEREQVPKCRNDERRIAIVALEVTVSIVCIIAGFARSVPMSFLKVVVENRLEPLCSDRTTDEGACPGTLESYYLDLETGAVVAITDEIQSEIEAIYAQFDDEQSLADDVFAAALQQRDLPEWMREAVEEAHRVEQGDGERYSPPYGRPG